MYSTFSTSSPTIKENYICDRITFSSSMIKSRDIKNQGHINQISSLRNSDFNIRKTVSDYDSMSSQIDLNNNTKYYSILKRRPVTASIELAKKEISKKMPSFWLISKNYTKKANVKIIRQHLKAYQDSRNHKQACLGNFSSNRILLKNIEIIKENKLNKIEDMKPRNIFNMMKINLSAERNKTALLFYSANKQRANNERNLKIFTTRIISSRRNLKF